MKKILLAAVCFLSEPLLCGWNPFACCMSPQSEPVQQVVQNTECYLAQLPLEIKNIIAVYCWVNQMRHEQFVEQDRYRISHEFYFDRIYYNLGPLNKKLPIKKTKILYEIEDLGIIHQGTISRGRLLISQTASMGWPIIGDPSLVVQNIADHQPIATIPLIYAHKAPLGLSCDGANIVFPEYCYQDRCELLKEFSINQSKDEAKIVARVPTAALFGHKVATIRSLPVYEAWYVVRRSFDDQTKTWNSSDEIICRDNKPLPPLRGERDYLSEFFNYRGVCKSLESSK